MVWDTGCCKAKMEWGREWRGGKDCCETKDGVTHGAVSAEKCCGDKGCLGTKRGVSQSWCGHRVAKLLSDASRTNHDKPLCKASGNKNGAGFSFWCWPFFCKTYLKRIIHELYTNCKPIAAEKDLI